MVYARQLVASLLFAGVVAIGQAEELKVVLDGAANGPAVAVPGVCDLTVTRPGYEPLVVSAVHDLSVDLNDHEAPALDQPVITLEQGRCTFVTQSGEKQSVSGKLQITRRPDLSAPTPTAQPGATPAASQAKGHHGHRHKSHKRRHSSG